MRRVTIALLALLFAPSAFADDLSWFKAPPLVGVPVVNGWAGFYIGGQVGYSSANADFSGTTQDPLAFVLRELTLEAVQQPSSWPVLGSATHSHASFGGLVGYNAQYEHLVLGVEANYSQADLSLTAPNFPISRLTSAGGNTYLVNITGSGTVTDLNFATLRARGGWAMGNFLPYAFGGLAVGHYNMHISATVSGIQNPQNQPCTPSGPASPMQPGLSVLSSGRFRAMAAFTVLAAITSESGIPIQRNFESVVTWSNAGPLIQSAWTSEEIVSG